MIDDRATQKESNMFNTYTPTGHDDWLEFRRQHLTSTELAGLHLHKQAAHWNQLREEKQAGKSSFQGNAYTAWGSGREPQIARAMDGTLERLPRGYQTVLINDSSLRYNNIVLDDGETTQTIYINQADDRLCCTPDLVGETGEVIGEIKTSGKKFEGGKFHDWAPDQYYLQCQLNMHYVGAEACYLLVEYRKDNPEHEDDPEASMFKIDGPPEWRVLEYDAKTIEALLNTADEWWRWIEHGERPEWMGDVDGLDDADELAALVEQLADAEKHAKSWAGIVKGYKAEIEQLVGGSYVGEVAGYKLTVAKTKDSLSFDSSAFRKKHADLYKEFQTKKRAGYTRITVKEVS